MTNKDNALRIIRFDHPQRVIAGPPCYWVSYFGVNHQGFDAPRGHNVPVGTKWTDIWGTTWHKEHEGVMGFPRGYPLCDPAAMKSYAWPDPDDDRICGPIYQQAKAKHDADTFLTGSHRDTLWEKAYMLVGMENMMAYFFAEPNYARQVLGRIMDFQLGIAKHYLAVGVQMVQFSDDMGTQSGPLLGPSIVREFLVPQYRRLFELYKSRGVLVDFHSCGNVQAFVGPLMELGADILNPVQATANDLDQLRAATRGRLALQGAISSATIMAGPPSKIEAEVRRRLWQLGQDGGYFCGPDQNMPWPQGHIESLHRAVEQHGRYPLQPPQ